MMEPKSVGVVAAGLGLWAGTGIVDNPVLLAWLIAATLSGSIASLSLAEHGRPRSSPRGLWAICGQVFVGLCAGLLVAPVVVIEWQPEPPYRPEHVGAVAFALSALTWVVLDVLLPPILHRAAGLISTWRAGGDV